MELFQIERFSGDTVDKGNICVGKDTEQKRLDALHEKIKQRRQQRSSVPGEVTRSDQSSVSHTDDIKNGRKRKRREHALICENTNLVEETSRPTEFDRPTSNGSVNDDGSQKVEVKRGEKEKKVKNKSSDVSDINDIIKKVSETEARMDSKTTSSEVSEQDLPRKEGQPKQDVDGPSHEYDHSPEVPEIPPGEDDSGLSGDALKEKSQKVVEEDNDKSVYFQILGKDKQEKKAISVQRSLPKWVREPIVISGDVEGENVKIEDTDYICEDLKRKLSSNGMNTLFPVQAALVPFILSQVMKDSIYGIGGIPPRDICVAAPTGSGKTLSYVLPIVQILLTCHFRCLQCLVIVPSKELASQIKKVFTCFTQNTRLCVGLASGQNSFKSEQDLLVCKSNDKYYSNVDILVSTPGRLVDHLLQTPGFSFKDLRFLVIDEADRLLGQEYSNWSDRIMNEVYGKDDNNLRFKDLVPCTKSFLFPKLPFQKLLFSATLTKNPEKLAPLRLHRPILFASKFTKKKQDVTGGHDGISENTEGSALMRYVIPAGLEQRMLVCGENLKPLVVLFLMTHRKYKGVLCFTKSKESTHRINLITMATRRKERQDQNSTGNALLLAKAFGDIQAAEFSAALSHPQRKGVIRDFTAGKIDLLISTDAMARGIDIENVKVVISYDPPVNIKTYIHRVGRTARAGQSGMAVTLLIKKEVYHFKQQLQKIGEKGLSNLGVKPKDMEPLQEKYKEALKSLGDMIHEEKHRKTSFKRKGVASSEAPKNSKKMLIS